MGTINQGLRTAAGNLWERLEKTRKDIGRNGYALLNEAVHASKEGIKAVKAANFEAINKAEEAMSDALNMLNDGDEVALPGFQREEFISAIAQEYVELVLFRRATPAFLFEGEGASLDLSGLSAEELGVSDQAWLSGVCDVPGEFSRWLNTILRKRGLSITERAKAVERFLVVAEDILDYLDGFETAYEGAVATTGNRHWKSTLRSKLDRIRGMVERRQEKLADLLEKEEVARRNEAVAERIEQAIARLEKAA